MCWLDYGWPTPIVCNRKSFVSIFGFFFFWWLWGCIPSEICKRYDQQPLHPPDVCQDFSFTSKWIGGELRKASAADFVVFIALVEKLNIRITYVIQCVFNSNQVCRIEYIFHIRAPHDSAVIRIQLVFWRSHPCAHCIHCRGAWTYTGVTTSQCCFRQWIAVS